MKSRHKRAAASRVLLILIGLFAMSGVLRVGGAGLAVANEAEDASEEVRAETATQQLVSPNLEKLLEVIEARTLALDEKEKQLLERSHSLDAAQVLIEKNLVRLQEAETALADTISRVDGAAEGDLDRLTSVYESMKPKVAAALFEQMTPDFSAGFLGRMSPQAAASIMSGLSSEASYAISVVLAGRHVNTPTH